MPAVKLLSCLLRSFIMGRYHPCCRFIFALAELASVLCCPSAPSGSPFIKEFLIALLVQVMLADIK